MKLPNLPSIIWVILLPLGLVAFIGGIMLAFYLLTNIEGLASVIMVFGGFVFLRAGTGTPAKQDKSSSFLLAAGIVFFALMGVAIDQPGNFLFNKPLEVIYCRDGAELSRNIITLHPLPGRTDIIQDFACVKDNNITSEISQFSVITVRFIEYVLIGYFLVFVNKLINRNQFNLYPQTNAGTEK
jgi:hypothetical protein